MVRWTCHLDQELLHEEGRIRGIPRLLQARVDVQEEDDDSPFCVSFTKVKHPEDASVFQVVDPAVQLVPAGAWAKAEVVFHPPKNLTARHPVDYHYYCCAETCLPQELVDKHSVDMSTLVSRPDLFVEGEFLDELRVDLRARTEPARSVSATVFGRSLACP